MFGLCAVLAGDERAELECGFESGLCAGVVEVGVEESGGEGVAGADGVGDLDGGDGSGVEVVAFDDECALGTAGNDEAGGIELFGQLAGLVLDAGVAVLRAKLEQLVVVKFDQSGFGCPLEGGCGIVERAAQIDIAEADGHFFHKLVEQGGVLLAAQGEGAVDERASGGDRGHEGGSGLHKVPCSRLADFVAGVAIGVEIDDDGAGFVLRIALDESVRQSGHFEAAQCFAAEEIVADAGDRECRSAQLAQMKGNIKRGATEEDAAGQGIPNNFTKTENGGEWIHGCNTLVINRDLNRNRYPNRNRNRHRNRSRFG